jgi:hypothetical protein
MKTFSLLSGVLMFATILTAPARSQVTSSSAEPVPRMVDPAMDVAGEPFSYASRSTDQLSVMHAPSGAELTPEGDLYTGFGELVFYVGVERVPVQQRIRTLADGYLPVISYVVEQDGLRYRFTFFAASLGPAQNGQDVVNFVRIAIENPGAETRRGFVTTAWRYSGEQTTTFATGDNRFRRPAVGKRPGDYQQPGEAFDPHSIYSVREDAFLRDGKAMYYFPRTPAPQLTASYRDYYNRTAAIDKEVTVRAATPMATAEYAVEVPAGGSRVLDFKVPLLPIAADSKLFEAVADAGFDERVGQLRAFWKGIFAEGLSIMTPELKVNDTFRASLVTTLVSLNKVGGDVIQTINQLQYHGFYLRDSADFVRMYDVSGYPEIAGEVVDFFASRQQPDGNFLSQPGQYDGWGEALWTYGEHYRMTHDKRFAASVYPRVVRAVAWLGQAVEADPLHLVPATDVRDNEYVAGHLTGYNFLALDGLEAAERLAHDLGHAEDEARDRSLEVKLRGSLMRQLDLVTAKTGGYMPPSLDVKDGRGTGGTDWGNLLSLTPEQQLAPFDPRVTATLRFTQARYEEGLITYRQPDQGTYLHHYLTMKNTETELIRGEQEQAVREFYAELVHTSSTHEGWEYSIRPWGDRDFSGNLSPHGWFAAEYRNLLRAMMVREEGSTLHLLSAVSPEWVGAGKTIKVERAATYFGQYGFELDMPTEDRAVLHLEPAFDAGFAPAKVVLHLPWFMQVLSVRVDGQGMRAGHGGSVELPADARTVELQWKRLPLAADMPLNYADGVERYEREYRLRYGWLVGAGVR